jgi:hypothetical protein
LIKSHKNSLVSLILLEKNLSLFTATPFFYFTKNVKEKKGECGA